MGEKKLILIGGLFFAALIGLSVAVYILAFSQSVEARYSFEIPEWVKANAGWWSEGHITDSEFSYSLQWLIDHGMIKVKECEGRCL